MKGLQQFIGIFYLKYFCQLDLVKQCIFFILDLVLSMPRGNIIIVMKIHSINPLDISNQAKWIARSNKE